MKIVTMKCLENYNSGKELKQFEFVSIGGSEVTDEIAKEFLQTNPSIVLKVLQVDEQNSQGLKDNFIVAQLHKMQKQIMD